MEQTRRYERVKLCNVKSSRALWETVNECVVTHFQTLIGLNERAGEALPSGCGWADCQVTSHGRRTNWFSPADTAPVFAHVVDRNCGYVLAEWVTTNLIVWISISLFRKCAYIHKLPTPWMLKCCILFIFQFMSVVMSVGGFMYIDMVIKVKQPKVGVAKNLLKVIVRV